MWGWQAWLSPKYLGQPEVTNIVSLLISCLLVAAVLVISVDKVASISWMLPYWVSRVAGQDGDHIPHSSETAGRKIWWSLSALCQFKWYQLQSSHTQLSAVTFLIFTTSKCLRLPQQTQLAFSSSKFFSFFYLGHLIICEIDPGAYTSDTWSNKRC